MPINHPTVSSPIKSVWVNLPILYLCKNNSKQNQVLSAIYNKQYKTPDNMGNINPNPTHENTRYRPEQCRSSNWSGGYILMQDLLHKTYIIKKILYMRSHSQAKQFMAKYAIQNKPQFYVINPIYIELAQQDGICSLSQTIHVYHHALLPTLLDRLTSTNQTIKQSQIWFILSELVHSLDILHGRNHPHLWVSPQTIYYNVNQNWLLEDMCYWQGNDYQNLINCKLQAQELVSAFVRDIVRKGQFLHLNLAFDEDIYGLGYAVIFMMTAIPPIQARKKLNLIFEQCAGNGYTKKLINLIKTMIEQQPQKRITLQKLKFKLKMQESKIIKQEMQQYRRERRKKSISDRLEDPQKSQQSRKISYNVVDTQTKVNSTPESYYSKSYSPLGGFSESAMRRNFVYLSPPHHYRMEARSPDYHEFKKGPTEFRFNSPRK